MNEFVYSNVETEYMFRKYVKKVIMFSRIQYDRLNSFMMQREELILDNIITFYDERDIQSTFDSLMEKDFISTENMDLENTFSDKKLYEIFKNLTPKQKYVLYMKSVEDMTDQKIAERLNITRQAVTKIRNAAVKRVTSSYSERQYSRTE